MPDKMRIEVAPNQEVTALVYTAGNRDRINVTVILGHGAGADQSSDFMTRFATGSQRAELTSSRSIFCTRSKAGAFRTRIRPSKRVSGS
jgi:predicted alpha/beta-hydrolase family hydrolase